MKDPNRPEERRRPRTRSSIAAIIKAENGVEKPKASQNRSRKQAADPIEDLTAILSQKVVGQPAATRVIVPYIQMYQAGLAPEGRPVGVFLLLGPTGTGKTKTIEALAEIHVKRPPDVVAMRNGPHHLRNLDGEKLAAKRVFHHDSHGIHTRRDAE